MNVKRILDANFNRASEGLRVLEDIARFCLDEKKLTLEIKRTRHEVRDVSKRIPELIFHRDATADVGAGKDFGRRDDLRSLVLANSKRIQEALRVIEENLKLSQKMDLSKRICTQRFKMYSFEKTMLEKIKRVVDYTLYLVFESNLCKISPMRAVEEAIKGGVTILQLREKDALTREKLQIGEKLKKIAQKHAIPFIVNDRIDLALALNVDGVHLGNEDMPLKYAREILQTQLIGISVDNVEQAIQAEKNGADYISIGSIFQTSTKSDAHGPVGTEIIKRIKHAVDIPVVAIGGITSKNVREVSEAGADGVAVVSEILCADEPMQAAAELKDALGMKNKSVDLGDLEGSQRSGC